MSERGWSHKGLFDPFTWEDGVVSFGIVVMSALSAAAGVGGGPLFIALWIIICGMTVYEAIPLSAAIMAGGSLIVFLVNAPKKHPLKNVPLIDFDLLFVIEPISFAGIAIGIVLNGMSPPWLIFIFLLITLFWTLNKAWKKTVSTRRENAKRREQARQSKNLKSDGGLEMEMEAITTSSDVQAVEQEERIHETVEEKVEVLDTSPDAMGGDHVNEGEILEEEITMTEVQDGMEMFEIDDEADEYVGEDARCGNKKELDGENEEISLEEGETQDDGFGSVICDEIEEGEEAVPVSDARSLESPPPESLMPLSSSSSSSSSQASHPWLKFTFIFLVGFVVACLAFLRGGFRKGESDSPIGVEQCGTTFWLIFALMIVFTLSCSAIAAWVLMRDSRARKRRNERFENGDIEWTLRRTSIVLLAAFGAGLVAGSLGINGNLVIIPILLALKIIPPVLAATSATIVLFTSSSSAMQYAAIERMPLDYGLWSCFLGMLGFGIGRFGVGWYLNRTSHRSAITLVSLVIVLVMSIGCVAFLGGRSFYGAAFGGEDLEWFSLICQ